MLTDPSPVPLSTVTRLADARPELFGAVKRVRAWSQATGSPRAVLLALATYADPDGSNARPSNATLARDTGLAPETVRRGLRALEVAGEILCTTRGGGRSASTYRIVVSPPVDNPGDIPLFDLETGDGTRTGARSPRGGTPLTVTGQTPHSEGVPKGTANNRGGVEFPGRCARHATAEDPPPCRGCMTARQDLEAATAAERTAAAERRRLAAEQRDREEAAALVAARRPAEEVADRLAAVREQIRASRTGNVPGRVQSAGTDKPTEGTSPNAHP